MSKRSIEIEAKIALEQIIKNHPKEAEELINRVKDGTCKCGANPLQIIHGLFGVEPAVRELEDSWECKKCGTIWPKKVKRHCDVLNISQSECKWYIRYGSCILCPPLLDSFQPKVVKNE